MAKSKGFSVGDKAVYPKQGVAEVVSIETKVILGESQTLYTLRVIDTDKKIMIPVDNVETVGLRSIISKKQGEEVYDILRERDVELDQQTWNRRRRMYDDKIHTGSPYRIAEVLRDLNLLKHTKTLSTGEKMTLEFAKRLLVQELAIAKKSTQDAIEGEIDQIFEA